MFRGARTIAIACACAICACGVVENAPAPSPATKLDEAVFRCNVEPILARQCSFNACHGKADSPLRIYTPGKLRATRPADIDAAIAVLTDAEHHANFVSAAGFNFGITAVDDNWLLRKPLPPDQGGYLHEGGVIYSGGSDPQYGAIRAWLTSTGRCP
jgi:hypothetical protein